jgi:hypothetical protein
MTGHIQPLPSQFRSRAMSDECRCIKCRPVRYAPSQVKTVRIGKSRVVVLEKPGEAYLVADSRTKQHGAAR